jgi:hypothetical protein
MEVTTYVCLSVRTYSFRWITKNCSINVTRRNEISVFPLSRVDVFFKKWMTNYWNISFVGSSCFLNVICMYMYLRTLVSNTISVSDDVRSFNNNSPSVTSGTGIANPLETPECAPVISRVRVARYFVFYAVFCR